MINKKQKNIIYAILIITTIATITFWQLGWVDDLTGVTTAGTIITVTYADGTKDVFNSGKQVYGLVIKASDTGQVITSIKLEVYITPVFTGTVQNYAVSGSFRMLIQKIGAPLYTVYDSGTVSLQPLSPLPALVSGRSTVIASSTLSAQQVESLCSGWINGGSYGITWSAPTSLSMTITFTDGNIVTKTANIPVATYSFKYETASQFTSLSAVFYCTTT